MNPTNPEVLNNMGLCAFNQGDNKKAVEYFTLAIREKHDFPRALNNMGNALRKEEN